MDIDVGGAAALLGGDGGGDQGGGGGSGAEDHGGGDQQQGSGDQGGGDGGADPDWYGSLSAEAGEGETASHRDYVKSKGFKDLDGLVKAYRSAEKGLHESGRIKVPGEGASAEDVAAFNKAIGVPDTAEGYQITLPETNGGLELDNDMIGKLAGIAHQAGLPKAGFEAVVNAYVAHQVEEHIAEVKQQDDLTQSTLAEWGESRTAKMADCQAAMRALGIDREEMVRWQSAVGSDKVLKRLAQIGGGIAEDTLITGGSGRFGISAAEAQAEINKMKGDPEIQNRIMQPNSPERQRWDRLNDMIDAENKRNAAR